MAVIDQTEEGIEALDVGKVENAVKPFPLNFQIRLKRALTEPQKDKIDKLVQKLLDDHGDKIFLHSYGDEEVEFSKVDNENGQSSIRFYFTNTTITESLVVGSHERLRIMTEFILELQKRTNNAYVIWIEDERFSENTGFGMDKKGVYPTVTMNNCPSDKRRKYISVEDYLTENKKEISSKIKDAAADPEPDPHPWIFEPFNHPKYPELVRKHKEKMAEKEKESASASS